MHKNCLYGIHPGGQNLFEMSYTYQEDLFSFQIKKKIHVLFCVPRAQRKAEKGGRPLWKSLAEDTMHEKLVGSFQLISAPQMYTHTILEIMS